MDGMIITTVLLDIFFILLIGVCEIPVIKKYIQTKWSTPIGEYKEFEGQLIPTYGQAIWHYDDIEFCYAKFRVEKIAFNVER